MNVKKMLAAVSACCLLLFSASPAAASPFRFSDVTSQTPHAADIEWLAGEGISTGWREPDGSRTFRPAQTVRRCDMAAFLYRLAGSPSFSPSGPSRFVDVDASTPHSREIRWLADVGISRGWDDATFRPYDEVARCDMAAFLRRIARYMNKSDAETWTPAPGDWEVFKDAGMGTPHIESILWLHHAGVSTGYLDGTFRPVEAVYRQDMAAFLRRTGGLSRNEGDNINKDHVHDWTSPSVEKVRNGYACNGCARDVTDWDDKYACCGGWHTHSWYEAPSSRRCSICGKRKHEHAWSYIDPIYHEGTGEVLEPGYWICYGCGAQSSDGKSDAPIVTTSKGFKRGAVNTWVTPFDFDADPSNGWLVVDKSWEPARKPPLQGIRVRGPLSLAPGDSARLEAVLTPPQPQGTPVIWKSGDPSVVSVGSDGSIKARSVGTAEITAECMGHVDSIFIRVTPENIGHVAQATLLIDGKAPAGSPIILDSNGREYGISIATMPNKAVYQVKYDIEDEVVDSSSGLPWFGSLWITGSASLGNTSLDSWKKGPVFTDPSSTVQTGKPGTATIVATLTDMNGDETVLRQPVVIR